MVDKSSVPKCCSLRWPVSYCYSRRCRRHTANLTPSTSRLVTKTSTKILNHHPQRTGRKSGLVIELNLLIPSFITRCQTFVASKGVHKYDGEIPKREARIHYPFGVTVRPNETVDSGRITLFCMFVFVVHILD